MNEMLGQLEESFQTGTVRTAVFRASSTRLATVREQLASSFEKTGSSMKAGKALLHLLTETERLSDIARNLSTPSQEDAWQTGMERLRFYLGGLAATGAEHVCVLTEKLGSDFASEAREASDANRLVHW